MATAIETAVRSQQDADPLDRALVRAKAGDEDAFRDLVAAISPEVTRWLPRGLCPDEDSASAVLQDASMTSWVRLTTFDSTMNLRRWVCRVAANNAITVLRRGRRERSVLAAVAHGAHPSTLRDVTWEPDQHREPAAESVENVIERLPSRYRSLAVLAFVHGFRPVEVAELLRLSRPGIKMRLHRLRALLRGAPAQPTCRELLRPATMTPGGDGRPPPRTIASLGLTRQDAASHVMGKSARQPPSHSLFGRVSRRA